MRIIGKAGCITLCLMIFALGVSKESSSDSSVRATELEKRSREPVRLARLQTEEDRRSEIRQELEGTLSELEIGLLAQGMVNVRGVDPTLLVELKYASTDNFMGTDVYGDLRNCLLRPEAARMLKEAHAHLKERRPDLRLLLADGFRPRSVQYRMWDLVKDTPMQPYVANPAVGSMHNYGAAVDITLALADGTRLDMGTPIDHFGILAQPREEARFLREGKLTKEQVANRLLLREVMTLAGFIQLPIEWWHFDAFDKQTVRSRYQILD